MKKRSLSVAIVLLFLFCVQHGFAQSNELVDSLLDEEQATMGNVAYLVFLAADVAQEDWSVERSVEELRSRGWGFENVDTKTVVDLGSLSFIIMQTFEMKGGIMYSILPGKRYAAKELVYLGFVPGRKSPYRPVSGQEVTHILGRTLDHLGQRGAE